jgi:phenylacetate-CoA ligase
MGYGALLGGLYRRAWQNRVELHKPKALFFGGDAMPDADRSLIEEELGIPVVAVYEAVEALRLAFQCEIRQGYHVSLDQVALRIVNDAGETLPNGSTGHVVLSNLTNRGTVLLNYKVGDMATLSLSPCPCGRSLPTIERIDGRSNDFVVTPSGEIALSLGIIPRLREVGGTSHLQVEQEELRRFVVRAVETPGCDRPVVAEGLRRVLKSLIGDDIEVTVESCEVIQPGPSGKVRTVISHVPRPE